VAGFVFLKWQIVRRLSDMASDYEVHVFGGWNECDRQSQAAGITGLSRQFFNDWLPPVEPWAYMDSFADKDKLTLNWRC
tara:strand:- start:754 stop:990 length:237 start_codon:yes stop_codon:yes gene_type:complete